MVKQFDENGYENEEHFRDPPRRGRPKVYKKAKKFYATWEYDDWLEMMFFIDCKDGNLSRGLRYIWKQFKKAEQEAGRWPPKPILPPDNHYDTLDEQEIARATAAGYNPDIPILKKRQKGAFR